MRHTQILVLTALAVLLLTASCITPSSSQPNTPTRLPPSATATATPTATATHTPTPTATSTPTPTATPTQICPSPPTNSQIIFSAVPCSKTTFNCEIDESSVANLYVINSNGSGLRQLLAGGRLLAELSLSPDGQKLAFIDAREDINFSRVRSHIYVWDMKTAEVTSLMKDFPEESTEQVPQWLANNSQLVHLINIVDNRGTMLPGSQTDLYIVEYQTFERTKLIERPANSYIQFLKISSQKSRIAFIGRQFENKETANVFSVDHDGSDLRELMTLSNSAYHAWLFWSPDGEKLLVAPYTKRMEALYVIDIASEETVQPIPITLPGLVHNWRKLPDGKNIELLVYEPDVEISLWALDLDTYKIEKTAVIPNSVNVIPKDWSADGEWIIYSQHNTSLHLLEVKSGCQYPILTEYYLMDFFWLPETTILP